LGCMNAGHRIRLFGSPIECWHRLGACSGSPEETPPIGHWRGGSWNSNSCTSTCFWRHLIYKSPGCRCRRAPGSVRPAPAGLPGGGCRVSEGRAEQVRALAERLVLSSPLRLPVEIRRGGRRRQDSRLCPRETASGCCNYLPRLLCARSPGPSARIDLVGERGCGHLGLPVFCQLSLKV